MISLYNKKYKKNINELKNLVTNSNLLMYYIDENSNFINAN